MNISDQAEGATRPHILMHGWLNAAFVLTHTLVSCWHVSSRFSNNLKHSTAGRLALLYTTGFGHILHRDGQRDDEHGGRTSYMYPRPNVTRRDTKHEEYRQTTTGTRGKVSDSECLRSESTAITWGGGGG